MSKSGSVKYYCCLNWHKWKSVQTSTVDGLGNAHVKVNYMLNMESVNKDQTVGDNDFSDKEKFSIFWIYNNRIGLGNV